jgi:hypothetical protein
MEINKDTIIYFIDMENMYTNTTKINNMNTIIRILKLNSGINENIPKQNNTHIKTIMGSSTLAILAEAYIQSMEHRLLYLILIKHQIIGCFRYVDNILLIYDQRKTNTEGTSTEFSKRLL